MSDQERDGRQQQFIVFVDDLTKDVRDRIVAHIIEGNIPDEWDGHELRQLLADKFAFTVCKNVMKGARLRAYKQAVLTKNLDR